MQEDPMKQIVKRLEAVESANARLLIELKRTNVYLEQVVQVLMRMAPPEEKKQRHPLP